MPDRGAAAYPRKRAHARDAGGDPGELHPARRHCRWLSLPGQQLCLQASTSSPGGSVSSGRTGSRSTSRHRTVQTTSQRSARPTWAAVYSALWRRARSRLRAAPSYACRADERSWCADAGRPAACSRAACCSASLALCSSVRATRSNNGPREVSETRPSVLPEPAAVDGALTLGLPSGIDPVGCVSSLVPGCSVAPSRDLRAAVSASNLLALSRSPRACALSSSDVAWTARARARRRSVELSGSGSIISVRA